MSNDIGELRKHLFDTLNDLRNPNKPFDLDRAKTIAQVAGTIIESAKVECQFLNTVGAVAETGFIPRGEPNAKRIGMDKKNGAAQ